MEYRLMEPPFEIKAFKDMNKKEAMKHFEWYVNEAPKRIELLREAILYTDFIEKDKLDFSEESLKLLWKWFIPRVKLVSKTTEEIGSELDKYPDWMKEYVSKEKLSMESLTLTMDIAIYFAEVFIRNFDEVKWGVITKPKSLVYVNRPVLIGFRNSELDTRRIIFNLANKVSKGNHDENALYNIYKVWEGYI